MSAMHLSAFKPTHTCPQASRPSLLQRPQPKCRVAGSFSQDVRRNKLATCKAVGEGSAAQVKGTAENSELSEAELEEQMEQFLRQQAEQESGQAVGAPIVVPEKVIGSDIISEEDAKGYCRDVIRLVKQLKTRREMSINEIRLTVAIEDPRARERRLTMGIEGGSGVSPDEKAFALMEVVEGRVPKDRVALRELAAELADWPFLDAEPAKKSGPSMFAKAAGDEPDLAPASNWRELGLPRPIGRDKSEMPQGLADMMPDWVGYGVLYGISSLPVIIFVSVIALLFFSSLK